VVYLLALLGVLSISFSAIFVRLAAASPVTITFFRALDSLPVLFVIWFITRKDDRRTARDRWLAVLSGVAIAADLNLWHESVALVGAGLGTLIPNVQVVFVAAAAWTFQGEQPRVRTVATIALILAGLALTSGLGRHDSYGVDPIRGVVLGLLAGFCYAVYLLLYRASYRRAAPPSGPLLDSTVGLLLGAIVTIPLDARFTLTPGLSAHVWILLLALVAQVIGWLFLGVAVKRLSAIEGSVMLLGQPVFAIVWGVLIFAEHLSAVQWIGSAVVLAGVVLMSLDRQNGSVRL
jgi:drug/metabolite transporter (DMT)-like permease